MIVPLPTLRAAGDACLHGDGRKDRESSLAASEAFQVIECEARLSRLGLTRTPQLLWGGRTLGKPHTWEGVSGSGGG